MTTPRPREHATAAGYKQHTQRGEDRCQPCRDANAARMREYRKENLAYRGVNAARRRALTRLGREYPDRFREILAEERAAPAGTGAR